MWSLTVIVVLQTTGNAVPALLGVGRCEGYRAVRGCRAV